MITTQTVDKHDPLLGFFHGWIDELSKHFDRIDVICLKEGEHSLPSSVHIHSLGKESSENDLKYIYKFYKYFWEYYCKSNVDYVFFHMGAIMNIMASPFFLIRKLKKTKFFWWKTHGHINVAGRLALCFVDRIYTAVPQSFPVESKKKYSVGHAIDTKLFRKVSRLENRSLILFVGRISRSKRVEQLIAITERLKKEGVDVRTRIVGEAIDKAYLIDLREKVTKLHLEKEIEFVGGVCHDQLASEYEKARIFINPSDNDGLDKVVLEAMMCGGIPITANISFEHMLSPYGLYMKKGDIEGYVQCVKRILAMSEDDRSILSKELGNIVTSQHALATLSNRIFF